MARAPKTDPDIDRLFQLPLADFVSARNALAKGAGDGAAGIRALQKPNVPAWAVNQLFWRHRTVYDQLIARAEDLRATHQAASQGKRADLRGASRDHEQAVEAALKATLSLLADDGQPVTDATRQAIATTLRGLPADEPAGRLTRPIEARGFEMLGGFAAAAGTVKAMTAAAAPPAAAVPAKPVDRKKAAADRAAAREQMAAAREAFAAAARAARVAEQTVRREEFEAARASRDADKARQKAADAEAAVKDAQQALDEAEREAAAAEKERDQAQTRVKRARAELEDVKEREEKARRAIS